MLQTDYFAKFSPNMSYVSGFMITDGSMGKLSKYHMRYAMHISVALKDRDILDKIRKEMNINNDVKTYLHKRQDKSPTPEAHLFFNSKQIYYDLIKLGITPQKTKRLSLINGLSPQNYPHFVRGVIDGDGCIGIIKNKYKWAYVKIACSSEKFLNQLQDLINKELQLKNNKIFHSKGNVYYLNYYGVRAKKLLDWVYKDSKIHLDRKYQKYQAVKTLYN